MEYSAETVFIGNIPAGLSNELLRELFELFGEVKEMKRIRNLRGENSNWAFLMYYDPSCSGALYNTMSNVSLGSKKLIVYPKKEKSEVCEDQEGVMKRISSINTRYLQELEKEEVLSNFISSYKLLHSNTDNDSTLSNALNRWLQEESEIRRRIKRMETSLLEDLEVQKQVEFSCLSRYDDDKSNDLFYLDRASWAAKRTQANSREGFEDLGKP